LNQGAESHDQTKTNRTADGGVTDHLWNVSDLVDLLEAEERSESAA
jgi:hypothetical protein